MVQEDSPYFALQSPKQAGAAGKVAPGMEVTYTVVFTPDDTKVSVSVSVSVVVCVCVCVGGQGRGRVRRGGARWTHAVLCCHSQDYAHELVCVTEREKFVIPVRGIGRRGVVDFPDEIHFPTAPVKVRPCHHDHLFAY